MKRDMELIRQILLAIEESEQHPAAFQRIAGHEERVVGHHQFLLLDAGLIRGELLDPANDLPMAIPLCLTWKGYEFLDSARDETIWNEAMQKVKNVGGSLTFAVLAQLLVQLTKEKFGMTP